MNRGYFSFTKLLIVGLFFFLSSETSAQQYNSSLGVKLGTYVGTSFTKYVSSSGSIEGIVGITRQLNQTDYVFGSYYRHHFSVSEVVPTLNWYVGLGFLSFLEEEGGAEKFNIAPGGVIGMEYTLENGPANFFLDVSPLYKVNSEAGSKFIIEASLGARYIFGYTQN